MTPMWTSVIATATGFLLGSIPFAYVLARRQGIDLRAVGSGNVGATNVLRVSSLRTALTVLALDAAKGSAAVWAAQALTPTGPAPVYAGLAAVTGHMYPPWIGFRGGKGMATAAGVFAVLAPAATLACLVVFAGILAVSRYVSLGSLGAIVALPVFAEWFGATTTVVVGACVTSALCAVRHHGNVRRLWLGRERRLGQRA